MASGHQERSISDIPSKRSISSLLDPAADEYSTGDGEVADDSLLCNQVEKKRRLTMEQVRLLEISFEVDNKLEPERKLQLAKELGLQPRQVAIWFQNRRARWKTKQLERDYNLLKAAYESLSSEKEKLQIEIASLNVKLHSKSEEAGHELMKRERSTDEHSADTASFRDHLVLQPLDACVLSLSENVKLKQPNEFDHERQILVSPDAASSSSNGGSPTRKDLGHEKQLAPHQSVRSFSSPSCAQVQLDAVKCDPNEVCALQSDHKSGAAAPGPASHLLSGKDHRLGSHVSCGPHIAYRQQHNAVIAFKNMEDCNSFQEEIFGASLFPLDEHYGCLWTSWD